MKSEIPRRLQPYRHPSAPNNNPYQAQRPDNDLAIQRTPLPVSRVDGPSDGSGVGRRDGLAGNPGGCYVAGRSDLRSGGIGDPLGCGRCCVRGRTGAGDRIRMLCVSANSLFLLKCCKQGVWVSTKGGPEDTHLLCLLIKASAL